MRKLVTFLISFFCIAYIFNNPVFAANENFSTSAQVTYTVNSSRITHVNFVMKLTNNTERYYATVYKIHLGFQDMQNIQAYDNGGAVIPSLSKTNDGEDLAITFNSPAFGKAHTTPFSFSFDTKEVASYNGAIWEVNIPGLSNANDFADFTVHVIVPSYFGNPTYIKPAVGNNSLVFTKDQLGKSGISLAFGDKQVYAFNLKYNLKNTQIFPIQTQIALPPNTSYQDIEIDDINPSPQNVKMDSDGNWLAIYSLTSSQELKITVKGKAFVSLTPSKEELTGKQITLYTRPLSYWETQNSKIQQLAQKLKTPEAIYNYVVSSLKYNFSRVSDTQDRLGAVGVLDHPDEAVCLEFTDLFIALSRAAGIPARELDGYGYTQNTIERPLSLQKEVLHAWPEYYDFAKKSWIMVDPTWENTTGGVDYFHTFDFDHLTFVIKGVSNVYPVPAGGYKLPGQESEKDVKVSFAPDSIEPQAIATAQIQGPSETVAGFPFNSTFTIKNTGLVAVPAQQVLVQDILGLNKTISTSPVPPFGSESLSISFEKTSFLTNINDIVTIHFAGKTIAKQIHITAFSTPVIIILGGILIAILSLIISFIARKPRNLSVS